MADNTVIPVGAGGDTISSDDISGVKVQRVKVQHGADGSATDTSAADPFPSRALLWTGSAWANVRATDASAVALGTDVPAAGVYGFDVAANNLKPLRTASKDAEDGAGLLGAGGMVFGGVDGLWRRARAADDDALDGRAVPAAGATLFNGANWDRARSAADGTTTGVLAAGVQLWGASSAFERHYTAQNRPDATNGAGIATDAPYLFNGSTYDRARSTQGDGVPGPGYAAVTPHIIDPATGTFWRPSNSTRDAEDPRRLQGAGNFLFNGVTHDLQRGNLPYQTALASAARTANTASATYTNHNARGLHLRLTITSAGTGSLAVEILNGGFGTARVDTLTSTASIFFYPGVESGQLENCFSRSIVVARDFAIWVLHTDASSWTYTVEYALIV